MKRLCIFSFFDYEGKVDQYVINILEQLKKNVEKLIVVINGEIGEQEKEKIQVITADIFVRPNLGFDSGAYKFVFNKIGKNGLMNYEQLILCNDTFYGPFTPIDNLLIKINESKADFGGLCYAETNIMNYIHSFFLVFNQTILTDGILYDYFQKNINEQESDIKNVYLNFELGLFNCLVQGGYSFYYFEKKITIGVRKNCSKALIDYGIPIFKKKSFSKEFYDKDGLFKAMQYIYYHTDYRLEYIIENAARLYGFKETIQDILAYEVGPIKEYRLPVSTVSETDIIKFIKENNQVYIYGAGLIGLHIWKKYIRYFHNFGGFIVSEKENAVSGEYAVYELREIAKNRNAAIIVGMNSKFSEEIRETVKDFDKVMFLWD